MSQFVETVVSKGDDRKKDAAEAARLGLLTGALPTVIKEQGKKMRCQEENIHALRHALNYYKGEAKELRAERDSHVQDCFQGFVIGMSAAFLVFGIVMIILFGIAPDAGGYSLRALLTVALLAYALGCPMGVLAVWDFNRACAKDDAEEIEVTQ